MIWDDLVLNYKQFFKGRSTNYQFRKFQTARSRLYQNRFLRPNTHFSAFFELYKIHKPSHRASSQDSARHDTALFRRLVLGWINADFRVQIRIFQHFSKSTRKSSSREQILQISAKKMQNFDLKKLFFQNFAKFCQNFAKILQKFAKVAREKMIFL